MFRFWFVNHPPNSLRFEADVDQTPSSRGQAGESTELSAPAPRSVLQPLVYLAWWCAYPANMLAWAGARHGGKRNDRLAALSPATSAPMQ